MPYTHSLGAGGEARAHSCFLCFALILQVMGLSSLQPFPGRRMHPDRQLERFFGVHVMKVGSELYCK